MKHPCRVGKVVFCFVLLASASVGALPIQEERAAATQAGPSGATTGLMPAATIACRVIERERGVVCQPLSARRRQLSTGVAHYQLQVRVGPGEHDIISLHRVVAERRPGHPRMARKAVLMIHGDIWGFEPAFLGLTVYGEPRQTSLPVFLAENGVDVWGISFRWAQVPVGFPDQSFMAGWGMDAAVSDARAGLRIARIVRLLTGQDNRKLHVLGWSRGVWTSMALANAEAAEPHHGRDIAGLIPVDGSFKGDPANLAWRQVNCSDYATYEAWLAAGSFGSDTSFLQSVGQLAIETPAEASPFSPGLTNAQFATGLGSWQMWVPGMEWYHFAAGRFDDQGVPTGFVYTDAALFFVELSKVFGYDPVRYLADAAAITCDETDVPWDDHLSEVNVPLLYVGAGGGFGPIGEYITQLVGSSDVTTLIVREQPADLAHLDIGHADIFQAPTSRRLFWEPILAWLDAH